MKRFFSYILFKISDINQFNKGKNTFEVAYTKRLRVIPAIFIFMYFYIVLFFRCYFFINGYLVLYDIFTYLFKKNRKSFI